jgi:4-hydroxybenzoate polyprenyltransferase
MTECECPNVYKTVDQTLDKTVLKLKSIKKKFFDEFIYGGHWLSLNAFAIAFSMQLLLGISMRWEFLIIVYFLLQCVYNYNHYKELEIDFSSNSDRVTHLKKYKKFFPYIVTAYGAGFIILLLFFGNIISILFGVFLLVLGLLYTSDSKKVSKKVVGFKSFYTAFAWALLIFFTAFYCSYPINLSVVLFFLFVFFQLVVTTSYFDIKDMKSDEKEGLLTLPLVFKNEQNWIDILHILNIISFIPIVLGVLTGYLPIYALSTLLLLAYTFYYLQKTKKNSTNIHFLSYVMVDGEYNFWPLLLLIGRFFLPM